MPQRWTTFFAAVVLVATTAAVGSAQRNGNPPIEPVSIFVGPRERDGFKDINRGIADSITDIRNSLSRNEDWFVLSFDEGNALLKLEVLGRGVSLTGDMVATTIGQTTIAAVPEKQSVVTLLKAGSYELPVIGDGEGGWRAASDLIVADLMVWVDSNRSRLRRLQSTR